MTALPKNAEEERTARLRKHPLYPELYRNRSRAQAAKQGNPRAHATAQDLVDRIVQIQGVIASGLDEVSEFALDAYRIALAKFEASLHQPSE